MRLNLETLLKMELNNRGEGLSIFSNVSKLDSHTLLIVTEISDY